MEPGEHVSTGTIRIKTNRRGSTAMNGTSQEKLSNSDWRASVGIWGACWSALHDAHVYLDVQLEYDALAEVAQRRSGSAIVRRTRRCHHDILGTDSRRERSPSFDSYYYNPTSRMMPILTLHRPQPPQSCPSHPSKTTSNESLLFPLMAASAPPTPLPLPPLLPFSPDLLVR